MNKKKLNFIAYALIVVGMVAVAIGFLIAWKASQELTTGFPPSDEDFSRWHRVQDLSALVFHVGNAVLWLGLVLRLYVWITQRRTIVGIRDTISDETEAWFCPFCGNLDIRGADFCPRCGKALRKSS